MLDIIVYERSWLANNVFVMFRYCRVDFCSVSLTIWKLILGEESMFHHAGRFLVFELRWKGKNKLLCLLDLFSLFSDRVLIPSSSLGLIAMSWYRLLIDDNRNLQICHFFWKWTGISRLNIFCCALKFQNGAVWNYQWSHCHVWSSCLNFEMVVNQVHGLLHVGGQRVLSLLLSCGLYEISRQIVFWKGKLVLGWSRWTHKIRVAFWVTIEIKSLVVLCANCSGNVMVLLLLSYFLMLLVGFLLMLQLLWSKSLFCSSTYLCVAVVRLKPIIVWLCSWFMGAVLAPRQLVDFCFWIARLYVATYFGFSSLGMNLSSDPFYLYVSSFSS